MKITVAAILLALGSVAGGAEESNLYQASASDVRAQNGEQVTVTFKEIERTPTKSVVELSTLAGGSVGGPMLIVKFMCGLARARGENFFSSRPLSRDPIRMEVTFPKSEPPGDVRDLKPSEMVFSLAQCDIMKF